MLAHFDTWWRKALFAACLLASLSMVAVAVASLTRQIGAPSPGFLVWENLVVPALGGRHWPGSQAGVPLRSVLVAVDGQPLVSAAQLRTALRAPPLGAVITYTFEHDGRRSDVAVPLTALGWGDMLPVALPYLLNGLAFFATGLVVFYFRPRLPAAYAGLALGMVLGGTLVLALDTLSSSWVPRLYFLLESLVPSALLHFALCFPEPTKVVRRHPSLVWFAYLPGVLLAGLQNAFLAGAPARHLAVNSWVYAGMGIGGFAVIASLVHTYRTSASPVARQRARIVAGGVVFAALVPSLGLLAVTVAGMDIPINFLSPFWLLYPLSIAYAIARHNLFEVDRYLRLGVVYAALTVLVFLTYAGMALGFERLTGVHGVPDGAVPLYLLALLLFFEPARVRIQRLVDRLFYREEYSYRATVEATSRALATILDTERIADALLETLTEVMAIEWGVLLVLGDEPEAPHRFARPETAPVQLTPALIAAAMGRHSLWTAYDTSWRDGRPDPLAASGATLLVPAHFEQRAVGLVALGGRKSSAPYTADDLDLIQTLVNQAALALQNAHATDVIRRTQQELVRAERLAAVGELSAAVAHGIRNPLAGIRAAAQVAREDPDDLDTVADSLDDIIHEADRLEHRVRTLLDFARPFEPTLVSGDLNSVVSDAIESLRRRVPPAIHFSCILAPQLPPVAFDAVQITEVIEALAVNAMEAMPGGGALRIETRAAANGEPAVELVVSDSGPGMDAAQQARIFDLFFTTKAAGTGLGLATVKRLVDRHRGKVSVKSEPGVGTAFIVRLPLAEHGVGLAP
ncbi:MAG TPA: ATP-binding protein [Candidatus Dormibacteraeota bacterium]|nr:ATP-binding protein [Candidatus Dormibacteraeota bacterium]